MTVLEHLTDIRILFVEASEDDLLLQIRTLENHNIRCTYRCVETEADFRSALEEDWHVILTDYHLPGFTGLEAIRLAGSLRENTPVIVVSGRIGEERAVEAVRAGACDYVSKDNLSRLGPIVKRELREKVLLSESSRTRRALEISESRYRLLLDTLPHGVLEVSPEGSIIFANRALLKMFGFNPGDDPPANMAELLGDGAEVILDRPDKQEISGPRKSSIMSFELEGGRRLTVRIDSGRCGECTPCNDSLILVFTDITERKALEASIRRRQKLESIGTLAGGIAHDFNNILMVMIGYTELALEKINGNEKLRTYLNETYKAVLRARDLVQQILTFSRQGEGIQAPVRLGPIVKEVIKLLRPSLPSSIELRSRIMSRDAVIADPTQLHQVLMNLCTNAFHAMGKSKGSLFVDLTDLLLEDSHGCRTGVLEPGRYVRLEISDTGSGIPENVQERIFEPYFTTKDVSEGTGLGLSVVHGIVKNAGGEIDFDTGSEGTRFSIFFPSSGAPELEEREIAGGSHDPRGSGTVLFVDDEPDLVEMVTEMLQGFGYEVTSTADSNEAYEIFKKNPRRFDCIITDQTMPGLTGFELARRVLAENPEVPVIICTGYSEVVTKQQAQAAGIKEFVMKPIIRDDLGRIVKEAIGGGNA